MEQKEDNYAGYLYFSPDHAKSWVLDIVKYCVQGKHKTTVAYSEYVQLVQGFNKYLQDNRIKLITVHPLMDDNNIMIAEYIKKIWGIDCELVHKDNDTQLIFPKILCDNVPDKFYFPYFEYLNGRQSIAIELSKYLLIRLLKYDIDQIASVYKGEHTYPEDSAPKFYLNTMGKGDTLEYVHKFINTKVLNLKDNVLMWDVVDMATNECVALIYLEVDKPNACADMDIIIHNENTSTDISEAIKFVKEICFRKLNLTKITASNYNKGWAYSTLNTIFHFAGFKAHYDIDYSTFEAEYDGIPSLDQLYTSNQDKLDNLDIE